VGAIHVHEFMSLDGVIDAPTWTSDYEFLPQMEKVIGAVTERCRGILLGRTTYEMFEPAWSTRTVEDDPGAPFFNDTTKYVVSASSRPRRGTTRRSSGRTIPTRSAS
jgi:dihydrofolate reductase